MSRDLTSAVFWLAVAIFVALEGFTNIKLGTLRAPGPGFFPFWASILLGGLSLLLVVRSIAGSGQAQPDIIQWRGPLIVMSLVLGYLLFLELLGFLTVTFLFLILVFRFGNVAWIKSAGWSIVATAFAYAVFKHWLQVQFPRGPFGL
jgi:putative tricarboxylic transport membrane protein